MTAVYGTYEHIIQFGKKYNVIGFFKVDFDEKVQKIVIFIALI